MTAPRQASLLTVHLAPLLDLDQGLTTHWTPPRIQLAQFHLLIPVLLPL